MTSQTTVKTLLILGASGDLTGRLLLPGLARLVAAGRAAGLSLVGAGSDPWTPEQWRERVQSSFAAAAGAADEPGTEALELLQKETVYHQVDVTAKGALAGLLGGLEGPVAVYFALPPRISQLACETLQPGEVPAGTRLVMEKPFGSSEESARSLNQTLARLVPEDHIHRVDHFLGKATVLNILGLRFANNFLEPVWNRQHVEKVEIFFDEDLALEGRARYTAGSVAGKQVPDYAAEEGVDAGRETETLAEIQVGIDNWRWRGVPFILRSGKALGDKRKEAVVTFLPVPHLPQGFTGVDSPNQLRIGFGPDTLEFDVDVNGPGNIFSLGRVTLEAELSASDLLPYGEVLEGVLSGDPLLSVRSDTAEDCWRIVEPVLKAWTHGEVPLEEYDAGSAGPASWPTNRHQD
ncbi:MAG: glucose-6-phosphate dehydrogenase [Arthrobacter sp.]